ncbi:hypothetical protein EBL87_12190 [Cereibacter sphaeroides]|nr:hypothetical protein EBL87_12190 [Cereibacter sphaeroides]AZB67593.1 hypothetical protein EBL86_04100 [Cereibacter sphaeroides]
MPPAPRRAPARAAPARRVALLPSAPSVSPRDPGRRLARPGRLRKGAGSDRRAGGVGGSGRALSASRQARAAARSRSRSRTGPNISATCQVTKKTAG